MRRWAIVWLFAFGCAEHGGKSQPPMPLELCELCSSDSQCESGICKEYGDGYRKCSVTCAPFEPAAQCAAPALGGCNGMGYCMCPFYEPPGDAGAGDALPLDAPSVPLDAATVGK